VQTVHGEVSVLRRAVTAAAFLLVLIGFAAPARAGEEVVIVVGKSVTLNIPFPIGEGTNSNPKVVQANVDLNARRITFFGRASGSATYTVYDARSRTHRVEYDIRVVGEDLARLRDDLERQIGDIEGVDVKVSGDAVIVEGDVALESELQRINQLTKDKHNVQNLVRLSPLAVKALARTIEQNIGRPDVTARPLKDKILLEGVVYSPEQKARAEAIATTLYQNIVDVIEIQAVQRPPSRAKTIVLNTHFLELTKELLDTWSINWGTVALDSQGISAFFQQNLVNGQLVGDFNTTLSGTVTAFLPKLNRAKPEGVVRILANPVITTKDGEAAAIFTGAEVPFVVGVSANGTPIVDFKQVGISLNATPYAQGDSVDLKLKVTASDVGSVDLSSNLVGILNSSFETSQFTRAGESVAIGGLFRVQDNVIYNKPTDVNPNSLFQFFLSRAYQKRKGQFIVFITPSVYDDSTGANREMKDVFNLQEVGQ
jgi:Flp pilus assembly secretin CpaC